MPAAKSARAPGGTPWPHPTARVEVDREVRTPAEDLPDQPREDRAGPDLDERPRPGAYIASTCSTKRTGRASCPASSRRIASGPRDRARLGVGEDRHAAGANGTDARNCAKAPAESATSGEWKAVATGSRIDGSPSAGSCASSRSTASVGPETTTWSGALWFATTTSGCGRAAPGPVRREARTAVIAPGVARQPPSAPRGAAPPRGTSARRTRPRRAGRRPRRRCGRRRTAGAAPRPRAGRAGTARPRRSPAAPTACAAARLLARPLLVGERRRREDDVLEPHRAPRSQVGRQVPGGERARIEQREPGAHPRVLAPLPREQVGQAARRRTDPDVDAGQVDRRVGGAQSASAAAAIFCRRSCSSAATIARRAADPPATPPASRGPARGGSRRRRSPGRSARAPAPRSSPPRRAPVRTARRGAAAPWAPAPGTPRAPRGSCCRRSRTS